MLKSWGYRWIYLYILGDIDELSHLVHILVYEHYSGAVNSEEIEKKYIDVLFLMLSRTLKSRSCMSSKNN